jgi:hypothetical protein
LAFCHVESMTTSFFILDTSMSSMFFASYTSREDTGID